MLNPEYKDLLRFVDRIAEMTHEGEIGEDNEPFAPTSEDSIATVNQLITEAREMLGRMNKCDLCGESVPYIIGCPNGKEICQNCFDAGQG